MERHSSTETIPQDRGFTLFTKLPPEVRLTIWEAALPEEIHPLSRVCEIWVLNQGDDEIATSPQAKVYMNFLRCCHESRCLALRHGCAAPLKSFESDNEPPKQVWIGNEVEMVFLPFEPRYLDRLITLPPNVKTLADTIGNTYDHTRVATVGKYITKWRDEGAIAIDTLYFGLVNEFPMHVFPPFG
ncbi:uncharacterized protein BKA55DRAFT_579669 [Fusarium redolens]|uniref:2EXR domain-containing protein n=1 Tax=Fusarium redolens TaxID=48865 RepID=A0A9P9G8D3_FUSRE|nr:uncharacterized protein BKA55DRAFT_579669 [Fusarium redolens]KAH7234925.1 hypothetical protein BKA55DRAFT_579669 [Fusarium redolens]